MESLKEFVGRLSRSVSCHYHPNKSGTYSLKEHHTGQPRHRNVFAWVLRKGDCFRVDTYKKDTDRIGLTDLADLVVPNQHWGIYDGADFYVRKGSFGEDYQKTVRVLRAILPLVG